MPGPKGHLSLQVMAAHARFHRANFILQNAIFHSLKFLSTLSHVTSVNAFNHFFDVIIILLYFLAITTCIILPLYFPMYTQLQFRQVCTQSQCIYLKLGFHTMEACWATSTAYSGLHA